jgi:hypothetical protein
MKRALASSIACMALLASNAVQADWGIEEDSFATVMFKMYCLDAKGSSQYTKNSMEKIFSEVVPLKTEVASEVFGSSGSPSWIFREFAKSRPVFIQAVEGGFCQIVTTGSLETMLPTFQSAMKLHAEKNSGELFSSGDPRFLKIDYAKGAAFTIKMPDINAYPVIIEEKTGAESGSKPVIRMFVLFGKDESTKN